MTDAEAKELVYRACLWLADYDPEKANLIMESMNNDHRTTIGRILRG